MDSNKRTMAKALSWQLLGIVTTSLIGWYFTGSLSAAFSLASISMLSGTVFYFIHEKIWQQINWGQC